MTYVRVVDRACSSTDASRRLLFWAVAYVYVVLLAGTNLASPLYPEYERVFSFSPLVVTLVFSAYVGTLIPSLLLAGSLSDAVGRRRVLLPAVGAALLGAALFSLADGTAWLFAARAVQGVAVGAASGALTATLVELEPRGSRPRAAMVSALALFAGVGAGPLLAGGLAQYAPAPRVLPFIVEIALLVVAAVAITRLRDATPRAHWRPQRPEVPPAIRARFLDAGMLGFLAGSVTGLFLTLVPSYLLELTESTNLALAGGVVAIMFAASAATQRFSYGRSPETLQFSGVGLILAGFLLLILAGIAGSLAFLLAATLVAGIGQGLAFLAAVTTANQIAPADQRAGVLSSFYVVTYLGTGLPVIGAGLLATAIGLLGAVEWFAGAFAAGCALLLIGRIHRRTDPQPVPSRQHSAAVARSNSANPTPRSYGERSVASPGGCSHQVSRSEIPYVRKERCHV
jgi:MFS family permease